MVERVAFKPGIKTRLFCRLPGARRPALQFGDLGLDTLQILPSVHQSGTSQHDVAHRGGYSFAEPQCAGVVLALVIDRLERLRTDALDIPEMKKLMCAYALHWLQVVPQAVSTDVDGRPIGVLHT